MKFTRAELKDFLDEKASRYNTLSFIETDPISIPHRYAGKEDREISGFLTAIISWGQRKTILTNMTKMMGWMDDSPYDFLMNSSAKDLSVFSSFAHRTFNGTDCHYFITSLQHLYRKEGGLEKIFISGTKRDDADFSEAMHSLKKKFFSLPHPARTEKHMADPLSNSSAKRICMFLRWMVRKDNKGVDFGIWNHLGQHRLSCPLDVHSGRVARSLKLLERKQNDWKAVCQLTANLKQFDPLDPVKYDYALFGLGVNERF